MRAGALAIVLVAAGCPGSLADPSRFTAACADVPSETFASRCATAGCHSADARAGSLDLESPAVAARLVGVRATGGEGLLIDPDNSDASIIVRKLTPSPPFGQQDPPGAPLDPATLGCIRDWVRRVAK
ncbi:MAG: hypothetical protein LC659_15565, partial [Myxococcales bacterium]|nr:hypothetical protein [Myxococcales bacterium]